MRLKTNRRDQLQEWGQQIGVLLGRKGALRIGETSVLSRCVHAIEPTRPGIVNVLLGSDAGVVFYQRYREGEILHLDIFHSLGNVDHRQVAGRIKNLLVDPGFLSYIDGYPLLDYTDLQTGTGGGRLSGTLSYGKKNSLRKAHTNHVHLAAMVPAVYLGCLVSIVAVVEEEIMRQGYQIRRVEGIAFQKGRGQQSVDMSAYASDSDSLLKGREGHRQLKGGQEGFRSVSHQEQMQTALDLAERVMNPRELKEIFDQFTPGKGRPTASYSEDYQGLLKRLRELKLVKAVRGKYLLTEKGKKLKDFLDGNYMELEYYFRKLLRKIPIQAKNTAGFQFRLKNQGQQQRGHLKRSLPVAEGEPIGELAIPETMLAAGRRWQQLWGNTTAALKREDLHCYEPKRGQPLDICLLIDASASMAGERMRAAKYLAQHLLLSTQDRVAVIVFQEQEARLAVPFTRNLTRVQQGLKEIRSFGLTPLSLGLQFTLDYLRKSKRRSRSLLFVITDGIPTVSRSSRDPAQDALLVAEEIARRGLHFGCIGLAPNKAFLEELNRRGQGNLYVITELQGRILAQILHRERNKLQIQ